MTKGQHEPVLTIEHSSQVSEQTRRNVGDLRTCRALKMHVAIGVVDEVKDSRTMTQMNMLYDTQLSKRLKTSINTRPVNRGVPASHSSDDLLSRKMSRILIKTTQHSLPRPGQSLAPSAQLHPHALQKRFGPEPTALTA